MGGSDWNPDDDQEDEQRQRRLIDNINEKLERELRQQKAVELSFEASLERFIQIFQSFADSPLDFVEAATSEEWQYLANPFYMVKIRKTDQADLLKSKIKEIGGPIKLNPQFVDRVISVERERHKLSPNDSDFSERVLQIINFLNNKQIYERPTSKFTGYVTGYTEGQLKGLCELIVISQTKDDGSYGPYTKFLDILESDENQSIWVSVLEFLFEQKDNPNLNERVVARDIFLKIEQNSEFLLPICYQLMGLKDSPKKVGRSHSETEFAAGIKKMFNRPPIIPQNLIGKFSLDEPA
jgi:hypothetical protein